MPPPTLLSNVPGTAQVQEVTQRLQHRDQLLKELKLHLVEDQQCMKKLANAQRTDKEFSVGDWVYLKLQPYCQQSAVHRYNHKLSAKFYGPFQITERIGHVAYHIALPSSSRVHPVFHVSQFNKRHGSTSILTLPIPDSMPSELKRTSSSTWQKIDQVR